MVQTIRWLRSSWLVGLIKQNDMWIVFTIMFIITAGIAWLWANGIEKQAQYKKDHPEYNETEGWLDWDDAHTEGQL